MIHAIKEKNTNRMVALVDDAFAAWFAQNMPSFDVVEAFNVGSMTHLTSKGHIVTICARSEPNARLEDAFYLVTKKPDHISLGEAYNLIEND